MESGLAGETVRLRERREKYRTGIWREGGERISATFLIPFDEEEEREGNFDKSEEDKDCDWLRN